MIPWKIFEMMVCAGVLFFFITFFRLSFLNANFFLAVVPGLLGLLILIKKNLSGNGVKVSNVYIGLIALSISLFFYCIIIDLLQSQNNLNSLLSVRILSILLLSVFPAFFISEVIISGDLMKLKKIILYSFILQLFFFFITYLYPDVKHILFKIIGQGDSILLDEQFISLRGFGLSAEINFMSPSLMVIVCFLLFYKKVIFRLIVIITQIMNSNMVIIAILLGYLTRNIKMLHYLLMGIISLLLYQLVGEYFIQQYFPRFYYEFLDPNANGSLDILLNEHVFVMGEIDIVSFLFGFQENVSSASNVSIDKVSDIGWVILFNYGGIFIITLVTIMLYLLSNLVFKEKKLAFIWFLTGLIFNTKGMIIGMNGYMFLSFFFIFTRCFNK